MPLVRFGQFENDIARARDLVGLGQAMGSMTQGRVDASDVFRASLAQAVAAMDSYMHGVVLDRAVNILLGRSNPGSATKVGLHFGAIADLLNASTPADQELIARTHVAQRLALETFQRPDDIGSALAMVGVGKVWATAFGTRAGTVKTTLGLIVARRNRIVHSCDSDPVNPGNVIPLTHTDALDAISTVHDVVRTIDQYC